MLNMVVLVSGGGTNLQAIMDAIDNKTITNAKIAAVISNNADAYALTRARNKGIPAECVTRKDVPDRAEICAGSGRSGWLSGCNPENHGRCVSKQNHQYPSGTDSVFLRNRLLRPESA